MCGILGLITKDKEIEISKFRSSLKTLNHRGPDFESIWHKPNIFLGHKRLSIIDLNPSSNQPMIDKKTGAVLIFNGMIYNYLELRNRLKKLGYIFKTNGDTEVLLFCLIEWKEKALNLLNGIWSFAIYFPREKKILLSRDRFGVKPLFFLEKNNEICFSSEPKAILKLYPREKRINFECLNDFFYRSKINSGKNSFYADISLFPQSNFAWYDLNYHKLSFGKYWEYPKYKNHKINEEEAINEFSDLLNDSINLRLRSDVPYALSLSGGIDSTSILASVNSLEKKITSFTSSYHEKEVSELYFAKMACSTSNSKHINVNYNNKNWINDLRKIVWHLDSPSYSPAIIPHYNLLKEIKKQNFKVLLEGQGADELLAGYPQYFSLNLFKNFKEDIFVSKFLGIFKTFGIRKSLIHIIWDFLPGYFKYLIKKRNSIQICNDSIQNPFEFKNYKNTKEKLKADHSQDVLPGLLAYGDSISMAHGIETRNPFLDYRLVEWVFKIPEKFIFNNNQSKFLLRKYLINNKQSQIANNHLKIGYNTPLKLWLKNDIENVKKIILRNLEYINARPESININKLIFKLNKNNLYSENILFKLLTTSIWIEECINK